MLLHGVAARDGWSDLTAAAGARLVSHVGRAVIVVALGWVALAPSGAWASLAAFLFGVALLARRGVATRQTTIMLLAVTVGVSAIDYLGWRWGVINWAYWWIALPLFLAEVFGALHTLGLQFTVWPRREAPLVAGADPTHLPLFIFIPTVGEGAAILEPTLRGALAARAQYIAAYPYARVTIVVCNDGRVASAPNWRETEDLAQQLGVTCITRTSGGGAKAGNVEHARRHLGVTGNALLVLFDADQIAEPDFLLKTVPPFADPATGWVQTGQYYRNRDNPVARWADDQQSLFYRVLCPGKARQNAAFICGTNVVLRAAALDEIGGLPQDSVTEDFAASIVLHPRWRGIFLADVLARGLGPMDLASYFVQQGRWATGTLGVLRRQWRAIVWPRKDGLRFAQRLQYALACTHYLCGVRDLIYIVAPLVFLLAGVPALRGAYLSTFLWHFLPYFLASQAAFWYAAWGKTSPRGIVVGFGSFPVLLASVLTVLLGRRIQFAVTAKQRSARRARWVLVPHAVVFLCCLVALGWSLLRGERGPVLVSALWVVYTALMLGSMLWLGRADVRARQGARRAKEGRGRPWPAVLRPARRLLGPGLAAGLALAVAGFMMGPDVLAGPVVRFDPRLDTGGRPYLGLWVPVELLASRPAALGQELGLTFAIIGRTQYIGDTFDTAWASGLAAHGARPWITLLFGVPGAVSLDAALPAIVNGVNDDALRRWARDVRRYGRPVYLTILPQVDQDWQPSSALANGGTAQDVPRAWQHARAIFRQEGASNVAWVWGPADPAHDAWLAPPRAALDVVLIRLTASDYYTWANPAAALAAVARRYPATPLFVQVRAAGPPARKAAWLRAVGAAVAAVPTVHALLYDESGPSSHVITAAHTPWSLASDPLALAAMRAAARLARVRTSVNEGLGRATTEPGRHRPLARYPAVNGGGVR